MKKALVTGAGGFAGSFLTQLLLSKNIVVSGLVLPGHDFPNDEHFNKIQKIECDLMDKKHIATIIKSEEFDYIFNLAAFSSASGSFSKPRETLENNIFSELNLLEALSAVKSKAKILIISSADIYGEVEEEQLPIKEETPLGPRSPYAVSKVAQDFLAYQFFLNSNLQIIRVRPFNHIGPGQSTSFVVPDFASQIAKLEQIGGGEIFVGNVDTFRDFSDVRDMVRAYHLAIEKGKVGEVYNIGSGRAYKIKDILGKLMSFSKVKIKIVKDTKLIRKSDIKKIYCDASKFKRITGWDIQIPIEKSLFDTIEYERQKLIDE